MLNYCLISLIKLILNYKNMKKILLIGAVALCGALNAQMTQGSWVVGGSTNLGFNNINTKSKVDNKTIDDGDKYSTFNLTPSMGYFVANNLAVGLDLGFVSITEKYEDYKFVTSTLSLMPTVTYYFKKESNIAPYLGAGVGYASISEKESIGSYSEKTTNDGFAWKAKGGVVYLITPSIGVDLGLSYGEVSNNEDVSFNGGKIKATNKTSTLGINAGFSFFF